ncbi:3,4-dihydroxyphenylacetate 2,3-dioxygenase [Ureibacillus sp. NPDC094379]
MILRLGFSELYVTDLEKSKHFYVDTLGFTVAKQIGNSLYLRAVEEHDEFSLILTEHSYAALANFGLRVSSHEYLLELKKWHDEQGILNEFVKEGIHQGLGACLKVAEPNGHPVVFYHEMDQISMRDENGNMKAHPMRNLHTIKGIPPLKIDHMNIRVTDVDKALEYWQALDFSISEYVQAEDGKFAAWTRRATTSHDVALVKHKEASLHHVAYIVDGILGVIRTADLLADAGYRKSINYGPGRHGATNAFFLYIRDPDGHRIEIYAQDYTRDLDREPIEWSYEDYKNHGRLWWGAECPESFFETTPLNKEWIKEPVGKK